MRPEQQLTQPFTLGNGVVIKNRLAKSAMSEALAQQSGAPTPALERLYQRWAEGGIGLCITGNVMIDRRALGEPGNVVIEDERDLPALSRWAAAGTRNNTRLWMQINHPGKQSPRGLNRETVAPSAIPFRADLARMFATPRALTEGEIDELIQRYARTAAVAKAAGFSGVQIHGAHGYLVSQFLSPHHNQRTDGWGGTPDKRRRFVLSVLAAMRSQVGAGFPIGIKLNSADFQRGGFTEEESLDTVRALVAGGFRTPRGMADAIASGAVDFVGLARALAMEPDLPQRLLRGEPARYAVRPIRTGIGLLDRSALMEIQWYTRQLHRIGRGAEPLPTESGLKAFACYAFENGLKTFRHRRLRA
jgi:2,4-dienoyl-CoA reductase-like NADH-dependent reductase (Old Yellow Enzyme family)